MPAINQPAPDFTLPDLQGRPFGLRGALGPLLVLNFWSAECPVSARTDLPLVEWGRAWGSAVRLIWVGCNGNESVELLGQVAAQRGLDCILCDPTQQVSDLYGVQTTPHVCVIDAAGYLRYQGAPDDVTFRQRQPTRLYLKEAVEALLLEQAPPVSETLAYGCAIIRQGTF